MIPEWPYQFLCVEGNIGSGKTSFCKQLAEKYDVELVLEQFNNNPFLSHFYENPARYALPVELFFMTERYKQLMESCRSGHIFSPVILADYFFDKTLLFARNNLNDLEFRLFLQIYESLIPHLRRPDLVLYIHRPVDQLRENIRRRGRPFELQISTGYLQSIQDRYFEYFRTDQAFPIVIVNAEQLEFSESPGDFDKLEELLHKKYPAGIHRLSFVH